MSGRVLSLLLLSTLSAASLLPAQAPAPPRKLLPVDEAAKDPSFFLFRAKLQEALARRDTAYLVSIVAPDIQNGFDGDNGAEAFKKNWNLKAGDSGLWAELARVLALGGKFSDDGGFEAPYVTAAWPADLDPFEHVAIVGEKVRIRAKPDGNSEVLASLSHEIVALVETSGEVGRGPWIKVRLADGREGYVSDAFVGMGASLRAYFGKKDGVWKMTALVAGD